MFVDVDQPPHELVPLESLIHYPKEARKKGIEGQVTVDALIDTNGKVIKVNVLNPSNHVFNSEAIRVIKVSHFSPAKQNGTPLKIWITRTIHFRLKLAKADQQGRVYSFPIVTD